MKVFFYALMAMSLVSIPLNAEEVEEVVEVLAPIPSKVSPQNWPLSLVSAM